MSRVEGLTPTHHKKLSNLLSYEIDPQAAYFSGAWNRKRSLLDKKGSFPTGLLYLVDKYLENPIEAKRTDARIRPKRPRHSIFDLTLAHTPYPEQIQAAEAAVANNRGIISCPTGTGKSMIIALIINYLQLRTLIVVPSLELKRQLTETLSSCFSPDVVGKGKPIWVENVDSLVNRSCEGYDVVIVDEFHHSGAKTYRDLNRKAWNNIYYRFGLTATPFRSKDNERLLLESVLSQVIYRLDYQTSVDRGYIVPVEAYVVDLLKVKIHDNPKRWAAMYKELVVDRDDRNMIIGQLLKNLSSANISALCLVKEVMHGLSIQSYANNIHFIKGENDDNSKAIAQFNEGNTCLIGTTGVIGEGVDTKPCEYVIIAGLGKSKNQFMQQIGRAVRRYPGKTSAKVILFKDPSHKWCLNHFNVQLKILKEEYGVIPAKLVVE